MLPLSRAGLEGLVLPSAEGTNSWSMNKIGKEHLGSRDLVIRLIRSSVIRSRRIEAAHGPRTAVRHAEGCVASMENDDIRRLVPENNRRVHARHFIDVIDAAAPVHPFIRSD